MSSAIGLVFFVLYILAIVGTAAGITWLVVKLVPPKKPNTEPTA